MQDCVLAFEEQRSNCLTVLLQVKLLCHILHW